MRVPAKLFCGIAIFGALAHAAAAEERTEGAPAAKQKYVLLIDISYGQDELHQEIVVEEGASFSVTTRGKDIRWTLAGDVRQVAKGHLPVMLKTRCYIDAQMNSTMEAPLLLNLKAKSGDGFGSNWVAITVRAREATAADQLPNSEVMEAALRRMIRDLPQPEVK